MKYIKAYVGDDFENGICMDCPLAYRDEDHDFICPLGYRFDECIVEIISE
jgi:hypothetical protein